VDYSSDAIMQPQKQQYRGGVIKLPLLIEPQDFI
jgi:hypothetical protein